MILENIVGSPYHSDHDTGGTDIESNISNSFDCENIEEERKLELKEKA